MIYGPQETQDKGTTQVVKDGETTFVLGYEFNVIATPGYTLEHICYFNKPYSFCGDTLLSGGCGRLFEGMPLRMYQSFKELGVLSSDTLVCCAHEYTLSNMRSALSIFPHDLSINDYYRKAKELRAKNQITLPIVLKNERQINVFLRAEDIGLIDVIDEETLLQQPEGRLAWLGSKKDRF